MQNLTEDSNSARRPQSVEIYGPLLGCGQSQTLGPRGGGSETGGYIVQDPEESSVFFPAKELEAAAPSCPRGGSGK